VATPKIIDLDFANRSLLFARLSQISYYNVKEASKQAKKLGFNTIEFYNRDGAQAYRFSNSSDLVIACRGTEPTCYNDIGADLNALPAVAETVSRVHRGFKTEVDDLWPMIVEDILETENLDKNLWFTGHSLGAAMSTIMASRCHYDDALPNPVETYTYGSPRVGWPTYVRSLGTVHHRWVNNNDVVCRVPFAFLGYRHHGTEHYLNAYGNVRKMTGWQRAKDRMRGIRMGLRKGKIDNFADHSIGAYAAHLEVFAQGRERTQN
jgi:triacylglycerol lipase